MHVRILRLHAFKLLCSSTWRSVKMQFSLTRFRMGDFQIVRVLVINPNCSVAMTEDIERATTVMHLAPDVVIRCVSAPSPAPPSINSISDGIVSAAAVFHAYGGAASAKDYIFARADAVVVACFSPHPLVPMLKETCPGLPVVGIYEAAVQTAVNYGRFGIVTTGAYWEPVLFDALEGSAGICKERCVGVRETNVAVLDLGHGGGETRAAMLNASLDLLRAGADAIVLGCAGMSPLAKQLQDDLLAAAPWRPNLQTQRVPVVDGVRAAIEIAANLVRQGR